MTLNPLAHLDPIGTIMIVVTSLTGFGIGWGKPVMVDPRKMRNPRWDHFESVAAGPLTKLLLAAFCAILLRLVASPQLILEIFENRLAGGPLMAFLFSGTIINLALCFFNLIPIGPLDGHWMIGTFMPEPQRTSWYQFNRGPGAIIFIILIFVPSGSPFDLFGRVLQPAVTSAARFFFGL